MDYKGYEDLIVEVKDGVANFRINRPDRLNAYRSHTRVEIFDLAAKLQADDDVRAVVCTAEGRGFCSGAELGAANGPAGEPSRADRNSRRGQNEFTMLMGGLDKPTIASVNGVAAGGGMAWACSFDMRIVGPSARFTTVFVRRAFTPDNGLTYFLPRLVGEARAYELFFTGREVQGEDAVRMGLGNEFSEDPDARAMELARELAAGPILAFGHMKENLSTAMEQDPRVAFDIESRNFVRCFQTQDHKEAVSAFKEKRKPVFNGN